MCAPFTVHSRLRRLASGHLCTGRSCKWGRSSLQETGMQAVMGADKSAPTEPQRLQIAYRHSDRAAILCQVELATSEV